MNTIQKIIVESKTQKAAAEKILALACRIGHPMSDAMFFVKEYKKASSLSVNLLQMYHTSSKLP